MSRRSGLLIVLWWAALPLASLLSVASGIAAAEDATASANRAEASPRFDVVLDLPYGSGRGEVGATRPGNDCDCWVPVWPAMFQMTPDGTLWVLDTVNSRVLAFRDGEQTAELSTLPQEKWPRLFGVTRDAIWIEHTVTRTKEHGPQFVLLRYDRRSAAWDTVSLKLPSGPQLSLSSISPLGRNDTSLLLTGVPYLGASYGYGTSAAAVMDQSGDLAVIDRQSAVVCPAADGSLWRCKQVGSTQPAHVAVAVYRYDPARRTWEGVRRLNLPRRQELYEQRKSALAGLLGLDEQGRFIFSLSEGKPSSRRYFVVSPSGSVAKSVTFEELKSASPELRAYSSWSHLQFLPDGSILAQYASPERYRILRMYLDD